MKIITNHKKTKRSFLKSILNRKGVLFIGVLLLLLGLFLGAIGYGAYLYKTKKTRHYSFPLLKLAQGDLAFVKNYFSAQGQSIDEIKVDFKMKHLMQLQYLKDKAAEEYILPESDKNINFPAKITYKGQTHKASIGLTGKMVGTHLSNPDKWSFQVKLKGDATIKGMKRFGLLVPNARGYLTDWFGLKLLEEKDLICLRMDFVNVQMNGKNLGVFYLEERFDKYLIENNRRREGLVFKLEDELKVYQESQLLEEQQTKEQLFLVKNIWQKVMSNEMPIEQFIDLPKMASLFAICDLMNNHHPLSRENLRFYFNPVTGLAEPIAREWETLEKNDTTNRQLFLETPIHQNLHYWLSNDPVLKKIMDNMEFKKYYIQELDAFCDNSFVLNLLDKHGDELAQLHKKIFKTWPYYDFPREFLFQSQEYIRNTLFHTYPHITTQLKNIDQNHIHTSIQNRQSLPIVLSHISVQDSVVFQPSKEIVLDANELAASAVFDFPEKVMRVDTLISEMYLHYHILGLAQKPYKVLLHTDQSESKEDGLSYNPAYQKANHSSFDFIQKKEDNLLVIPKGNWTLTSNLVIPSRHTLVVESGTQIDLKNQAQIVSRSPIFFEGEENLPITIMSSDSTGQGIRVVQAKGTSLIRHTTFEHLTHPNKKGWSLPGAVTFYESPVQMTHCNFKYNFKGDDFLNIVRSSFYLSHCLFEGTNADAFDGDFSQGLVENCTFINIGNDAVDFSGSIIDLNHVMLDKIGDKGLSAGESTTLTGQNISIMNAEIGVTSKDNSIVSLKTIALKNNRIGVTLFQKKSEFGPAFIEIDDLDLESSELPYLVEVNSTLKVDGVNIAASKDNVKAMLYGAEYGKSSK